MNIKSISSNVGRALLVSALFMFLSLIVSIIDGRDSAFAIWRYLIFVRCIKEILEMLIRDIVTLPAAA